MRRFHRLCCLLSAAVLLTASCISDKDDETVLYNDMAITSFTLGTLNRYVHTTSSTGADSVYTETLTGSNYKMTIDQLQHRIFNSDSLPVGTDIAHVICTITTRNNGLLVLKDNDSDTLFYYNATDSIDFSEARELQVYASDGSGYEAYTVTLNVHQEDGDEFNWTRMADNAELGALSAMRAVNVGGRVLVFGTDGTASYVYATGENDGNTWQLQTLNFNTPLAADAYQNVVTRADSVFILSDGCLLRSADGAVWEQVGGTTDLKRLVAASTSELYGITAEGKLTASRDGGNTWAEEQLDEDASLLPTADFAYNCSPMNLVDSIDYVLLVGNQPDAATEGTAKVWRKIVDYSADGPESQWVHIESSKALYALPSLSPLALFRYGDGIFAIGGNGIGTSTEQAFETLYQTRDNGIHWKDDSPYSLPDGLQSSSTSFAVTTDSQNHIWFIGGESGQVWRGRLNSMGWK
ncbi:MAG: hypothetical protein IJ710_04655 [Prevotella sp.]|nr:hypothetical protein [Prevotella sp.]